MRRHLFAAWPTIVEPAEADTRLAVFTDFDGTLAPIRRRAAQARLSARVRRALERLAEDGHLVAVVSGRPLADLASRVGIAGVWYAGSHGYFLQAPDGVELSLLRSDERRRIIRFTRRLTLALGSMPDVSVEPKPGIVAIHYRGATTLVQRQVAATVRRLCRMCPGLRLWPGRMVWEVLPAGPVDKYLATRFILRAARQRDPRPVGCSLYLGDDESDEQVFARWTGISVAVGRRSRTAACYLVRSPAEVAECLERLGDAYKTSRQRGEAANAPRIIPTWE